MKKVGVKSVKSRILEVSEPGTRFDLSFSSRLVFGNKIIALDGKKKCLLVVEKGEEASRSYVIDLNEIAAVTIKRSYGSIRQGELSDKGSEAFLKSVDLQLAFIFLKWK